MPNSFTVFPNVLPGNVSIGGNLTVNGDQLRIGAAAPFVRVGKDSGGNLALSENLGFDDLTVDSAGTSAWALLARVNSNTELYRRLNAAGTDQDGAIAKAIFSDYTTHVNTGNTTENTILTKTIPANTLGANGGLRVRLIWSATAQGGVAAFIRLYLGATNIASQSFTVNHPFQMDVDIFNRNAANAQAVIQQTMDMNTATFSPTSVVTPAVDTTADQILKVTAQCGTATDSQRIEAIIVHQLNSFGPV